MCMCVRACVSVSVSVSVSVCVCVCVCVRGALPWATSLCVHVCPQEKKSYISTPFLSPSAHMRERIRATHTHTHTHVHTHTHTHMHRRIHFAEEWNEVQHLKIMEVCVNYVCTYAGRRPGVDRHLSAWIDIYPRLVSTQRASRMRECRVKTCTIACLGEIRGHGGDTGALTRQTCRRWAGTRRG